jgi:hypothetical protein
MKKFLYIGLTCLVAATTACRKYVEIPAELNRELKYTKDYQALLYNTTTISGSYGYPVYAADDIGSQEAIWQNYITNTSNQANGNAYIWAEALVPFNTDDLDWNNFYSQARICNIVINEVMDSEGGTAAEKQRAQAEALVHRAYIYYTLVNTYAKQYDAATAGTDPGVPLQLENKFFGSLQRASVQTVYNQLAADLKTALPALPGVPDVNTNPSQAAVYAMLSRVYLNMRNFTEASRFADSTLKLKSTLLDLNSYYPYPSANVFPGRVKDPECILYKGKSFSFGLPLTDEVLALLGTKDLRYQVYTAPGSAIANGNSNFATTRGYRRHTFGDEGINTGLGVPETMLIKAECEARAGHADNAITILNTLRKKRFTTADYADLVATTPAAALETVVKERRIELMANGTRWFDQRRLAKDPGMVPTVTRNFKGAVYTLAPGSNRYVFPIADKYITYNPEITQNPR